MKEYSGYDTKVNGLLIDDLRRTKGANTLFVSHYFLALNDGKELIFYYNPMHFWDKVPIEKVEDYAWKNLEKECAIIQNVDLNRKKENGKPIGYEKVKAFDIYTPRISNHYSCLSSRILTHNSNIFFKR